MSGSSLWRIVTKKSPLPSLISIENLYAEIMGYALIQHKFDIEIRMVELAIQGECSQSLLCLEEVAQALGTSSRSLQRGLRQQGTSFSHIRQRVRCESALKLLRQDNFSISEIAQMLEYSDPSNFCRAFQRWTGQSPTRWRKAVLQQGRSLTRTCKY